MKTIPIPIPISCALLLLAEASIISEQCKFDETTTISCRCIGNEEFAMPEGYNYENVTSLRISSCAFANLHFSSFTEASRLTEIVVQNIGERLIFEPFLTSRRMKRLKLSKIRRIPLVSHDTFLSLRSIDTLRIEDTRIENFEERFVDIAITNFSMINVTIERIDELNFSPKGKTLRIEDSDIRNVAGSLNFGYYSNVQFLRSKFRLQKPGYVSIEADVVLLEGCVFSNASANVVAANGIRINGTCADGKSSMRLSSSDIKSANNRLPTEIIYTKIGRESDRFFIANNTVCVAGNCKCPKSSGQSSKLSNFSAEYFFTSLILLLSMAVLQLGSLGQFDTTIVEGNRVEKRDICNELPVRGTADSSPNR